MNTNDFTYLLNKWIENTISEEELAQLKQHKEFASYQKILENANGFLAPDIDDDTSFKNFINKTDKKTIKLIPKKKKLLKLTVLITGIAASIALLLGLFNLLSFDEKYQADFGEQLAVYLPDSSLVVLNSKSSLKFTKKEWNLNRFVTLEGEAFFKVKKGSQFKVQTKEGEVQVLGTKFNVKLDVNYLEVQCFEGKVAVTNSSQNFILTQGKAVRLINNNTIEEWDFNEKIIPWQNNETTLKNVPLKYVFSSIEKTFGITIKHKKLNINQRFSGSFPNDDLILALETVSESLAIEYIISKDKKEVEFHKK